MNTLSAYIESLRPIIYIPYFDSYAADFMIREAGDEYQILEYNDALGAVDFHNKKQQKALKLREFLGAFERKSYKHTILVLKDIHNYLHDESIVMQLKQIALRHFYEEGYYVTVIIVSSALVIPHQLEKFISVFRMPVPNASSIRKIMKEYVTDLRFSISQQTIDKFIRAFQGLTQYEILQVLNQAFQQRGFIDESNLNLVVKEKKKAISSVKLLSFVEHKSIIQDIGGLETLKQWFLQRKQLFFNLRNAKKYGLDTPKGILISGIPGSGKSLITSAFSDLLDLPLLRMDLEYLSVMQPEEAIYELNLALEVVENFSPCILWWPAFEQLLPQSAQHPYEHNVYHHGYQILLDWLKEKNKPAFVIVTSPRGHLLPKAFLDGGYFDACFYIDLPTPYERGQIFKIHLKQRNQNFENLIMDDLIEKSEGYSGGEIAAAVKLAVERAFLMGMKKVDSDVMQAALTDIKPARDIWKEELIELRKLVDIFGFSLANTNLSVPLNLPRIVEEAPSKNGKHPYAQSITDFQPTSISREELQEDSMPVFQQPRKEDYLPEPQTAPILEEIMFNEVKISSEEDTEVPDWRANGHEHTEEEPSEQLVEEESSSLEGEDFFTSYEIKKSYFQALDNEDLLSSLANDLLDDEAFNSL